MLFWQYCRLIKRFVAYLLIPQVKNPKKTDGEVQHNNTINDNFSYLWKIGRLAEYRELVNEVLNLYVVYLSDYRLNEHSVLFYN